MELFTKPEAYPVGVYVLPKHLDEEVARLHLDALGVRLTTLTDDAGVVPRRGRRGPLQGRAVPLLTTDSAAPFLRCRMPGSDWQDGRGVTQAEDFRARVLVVDDDAVTVGDAGDRAAPGGVRRPRRRARRRGARRRSTTTGPIVVLLDLMLPGKGGIDVCTEIRAESGVPIVMLTAKGDTVDVVVGLESGRRRLRREAVQAQGAGRPHPGPGAPKRDARRGAADRSADSTSTSPVTR